MNQEKINRLYKRPVAEIISHGKRFLGAMKDGQIGQSVVEELAPAFVANYATQLEQLERLVQDRANARGAVSVLTRTKADAKRWLALLSGSARQAAKAKFAGQDSLLHGEFRVADKGPRDVPSILKRATELLAACKKHEEELASEGWGARQNAALEAAINALDQAHQTGHVASDAQEGLTADQRVAVNRLYRMSRAIQGVARYVHPASKAAQDPAIVEARARFLLAEFPVRRKPPAPTSSAPADPAGTPADSASAIPPAGHMTSGSHAPAARAALDSNPP